MRDKVRPASAASTSSLPGYPVQRPPRLEPEQRMMQLLERYPAFRALLRSVEEHLVAECWDQFREPILDLGCGDGVFGMRSLQPHRLIGVDPALASLAEASMSTGANERGNCARWCSASATEMPFRDGVFRTILVNSVFEHIPDLDAALNECQRVLHPEGMLVMTAPNPRFSEHLLGVRILKALAGPKAGALYARWFNRHSQHYHLLSQQGWQDQFQRRGLRVTRGFDYFSPQALRVMDILHYLGLPALLSRKLFGRWVLWRNPLTSRAARSWLGRLTSAEADPSGSYSFLTVSAVSTSAASTSAASTSAASTSGAPAPDLARR